MRYELWDTETRNVVGVFGSEPEALEAVRQTVSEHGRACAEGHVLLREDGRGRTREVAHGAALVARALSARSSGERAHV